MTAVAGKTVLKVTPVSAGAAQHVYGELRGRADLVYVQTSQGEHLDAVWTRAHAKRVLKRSVRVYGSVVVDEAGLCL